MTQSTTPTTPANGSAKVAAVGQAEAAADASAPKPATDASPESTDTATPAETAVQTPQPNAPAQQTSTSEPAATLLSLLAAMSGGAKVATGDPAATADEPAGESVPGGGSSEAGTTVPVAALSGSQVAATGTSNASRGVALSGVAGIGGAKAAAGAAGPGTIKLGAEAVATGPAGSNDPASAAVGPGQDFLSALADAGQAGGQGSAHGAAFEGVTAAAAGTPQTMSPTPSGGSPTASAPSSGTTSGAQAAGATAPSVQADPAIPIGQVPMTIGLRSLNGSNAFQIRLDPIELGRIDVKLEIDKARGAVTTHLVVDRPETLAMLQRDAGQLQQALTQAGLDPSAGSLNLSLRGDGGAQGGGGSGQQGGSFQGGSASWTRDQAEAPQETAPTRWLRGYGGLDIRI